MNKILVKVFFPRIDKWYEIWIPTEEKISNIIKLLCDGVNELNDNVINSKDMFVLYNRKTGRYYDFNVIVKETDIKNGTELILV